MLRHWYYSLLMLVAYVGLFVYWKYFPSRSAFLLVGLAVASLLSLGFWVALRKQYFTGRVDKFLHAYVIADVVLESVSFEPFRLLVEYGGSAVSRFHDNNNFLGCSLAFTLLVGGYRWWSLRRLRADRELVVDEASCSGMSPAGSDDVVVKV